MENTEIATITEDQLKRFEEQVRKGSAAFIQVGTALAKIREGKGYKLRGFDTFESYCQQEFGFTDRQGRRLIQSAETSASVKKLTGAAPANESVAREWAPLVEKPKLLNLAVEKLEKKGYSVVTATAEMVKEMVQTLAPKPSYVPGNGKAVVVPGNGHKATLASIPAGNADPGPGACPWCGERPDNYGQSEEVWQCSDCKGIVMLSVIKWPPEETSEKVCPACKHTSNATHRYCDFCGNVL